MKQSVKRFIVILACLAAPAYLAAQNDALRESMDNAQAAKDELKGAIDAQQGNKVTEASDQIVEILQENRKFWADKKMPDVLEMFDDTIRETRAISAMGKSGKLDGAKDAFAKLNASCSRCHDAHPEQKLP